MVQAMVGQAAASEAVVKEMVTAKAMEEVEAVARPILAIQ